MACSTGAVPSEPASASSSRGGDGIYCAISMPRRGGLLVSAVSGCQDACCDIRYCVVCSACEELKISTQIQVRTMLHIPKSTDKLLNYTILTVHSISPTKRVSIRSSSTYKPMPLYFFGGSPSSQYTIFLMLQSSPSPWSSCRSSYNPSNLFVALLAEQLSLVIVHHRVVASGEAIASRVPSRPVAASASVRDPLVHTCSRSPQGGDDERHRSSHCCHSRYGDDGILDPWLIAVKRRAVVSQSDLAEFAIPVAPDIPADGGSQADRDHDGEEDDPARCSTLALKLLLVSLAGVFL